MTKFLILFLISIKTFSQTLDYEKQNEILEKVYYTDQELRKNKNGVTELEFNHQDSINLVTVDRLIKDFGFPSTKKINRKAYLGLFYAIQHSDIKHQSQYINNFKTLADSGLLDVQKYAMMFDRILVGTVGKQKYGEQFYHDTTNNTLKYEPFINKDSVQIFRAQLGLKPINLDVNINLILK